MSSGEGLLRRTVLEEDWRQVEGAWVMVEERHAGGTALPEARAQ
jgi:hypothetical protein